MSNKPKIYANCKSGCLWETVHKSDFEQSASHARQYPKSDGLYYLEIGKEYKIFANHNETAFETDITLRVDRDNGTHTNYPIATPRNDEYADSFVFKLLQANDGYMVYELGGVRYKEVILDGISATCTVSNATKVFLYNADAEILVRGDVSDIELPQTWEDINKAYERIGEDGHKIMGGLIYKDFDGNIKVYPLAPAYGVRRDECGYSLPSVVVYNSAQQIMAKPATDGRHTVSLRQLDEFFGGGSTSDLGEKASSLQKIPPVDLTPSVNERKCYVFCRDSQNHFAPKYYSEPPFSDELAERDSVGRLRANAPDLGDIVYDDYLVNVNYLNRILNQRLNSYLPLSGGTMTGTHTIKRSNPCLKLNDTSDNTTAYVQLYQGLLRLGYTWAKSLTVDKDGNAGVAGNLTVGGRVSCADPTGDTDAVNVRYLNDKLAGVNEAKTAAESAQTTADEAKTAAENAQTTINALKTETLTLTYEDGTTRTLEVYVK